MSQFFKFIPALMNSDAFRNNKKKWISLIAVIFSGYQLFSANGVGANLGIPSLDTFYTEPRDILVDRVESARDVQLETAEEFKSALEKFKVVTHFEGGDLEEKFATLNAAFEDSEKAAAKIENRVDRVVTATNKLLDEWRIELNDYHDVSIKQKAQGQFDDTRLQAEKLISAMRKAQQKTEPVLGAFRDQVLFVKHNLNMQAISSLQEQSSMIEQDVSALIAEMEVSIAEAEAFIQSIKS